MKKIYPLIFSLIVLCNSLYADGVNEFTGARAAGMGGISIINQDVWSVFNNQAGMAYLDKTYVGIYYENNFLLKETGYGALSYTMPALGGSIGLSISNFGYSLYNTNEFGIAYALKLFKNMSMGIKVNYHFVHQPLDYGNRHALSFDIGILANPTDKFYVGTTISNPIGAGYFGIEGEHLPIKLGFGTGYSFSKNMTVAFEALKTVEIKEIDWRVGIEYISDKGLALRTGIKGNPTRACFGIGYKFGSISANLSYSWHNILGSTPHIGLSYAF